MLKQINAFDTGILKKRRGIIIAEQVKTKVNTYHALIYSVTPLKLTIAYLDGDSLDLKDIRPAQVVDGTIKISLMVPFTPGSEEVAATSEPDEEEETEDEHQ